MNLSKLFKIQKQLDERIVKEKRLEGQDLLDKKILALQVELGELANEWRGFKFWKVNPKPNDSSFISCRADEADYFYCGICHKSYSVEKATDLDFQCPEDDNNLMPMKHCNPMLEEYVDCLHFILSIGNDCHFENGEFYTSHRDTTTEQFNRLFQKIGDFSQFRTKGNYEAIFHLFLALGEMLGFTWEQIEQEYLDKNKINHERLESGY